MAVAQHRVSLPLVGPTVEDLLLWRDIKKSGLVFGSITAIFLFVGMSSLSPLALALRALAYGSLVAIAWSLVGGFFGRSGPPVPPILNSGFTEESFTNLASSLRPHVNTALSFLGTVVSGKNPKLGLQVFGAAFLASYLVNLPILALSYTVALLAFTLPKLYELRKDDADKIFAQAKAKFDELYAKFDEAVLKKLPKGGASVPKKEQ